MAAVHEEDRLAAAEAGVAGPSAAEQKADIRNALNAAADPDDVTILVGFPSRPSKTEGLQEPLDLSICDLILFCCRLSASALYGN